MVDTERISVRDFGAKGNGVDDDSAAIQAAINSLYRKEDLCSASR
jgi:polygalacturonase